MFFSELLKAVEPLRICGETGIEIHGLCYDSRHVVPGGLFFALRGNAADGHSFIETAVRAGAVAVVAEDGNAVPAGTPYATVADSRRAMALMAALYYGNPSDTVPLIGITGTNGKTTTSYMIEAILEAAGFPTAVLGTVSYRFRDKTIPAPHTTPESAELQKILRGMAEMGAKAMVMEVSSHALDQRRVEGCRFDAAVFTNLTRDHLDYHLDMESYLASKKRLFSELLAPDGVKPRRMAAVNMDNSYGTEIAASSACPVVSYGLGPGMQVSARDICFTIDGITGILSTPKGQARFSSPMPGRFNLYNILAAAAVGTAMDLPFQSILSGIERHRMVPGRLERVENKRGVGLFVDYAHTGDALENVLSTLSELATRRIITIFGCGGDRDRGKRPVMGEVAGRFSDLSIITSDNPRTEVPSAIMEAIKSGIRNLGIREYGRDELAGGFTEKGYILVESRREAIRMAVRLSGPGDIVLLAGKGHEDYQIIGREKIHFDDREEAAAAFRELG